MASVAEPAKAPASAPANQTPAPTTLFRNVHIFSGQGTSLSGASNVLVRGNHIERISAADIAPEAGTTVIDGAGRTLMPGLIDMHWHSMLPRSPGRRNLDRGQRLHQHPFDVDGIHQEG